MGEGGRFVQVIISQAEETLGNRWKAGEGEEDRRKVCSAAASKVWDSLVE